MKNRTKVGALAGAILLLTAFTGIGPAAADQTSASGSISCLSGYHPYVSVYLDNPGNVVFYKGNTIVATSVGGSSHVHHYTGLTSVSWKVTGHYIATASDFCVQNATR